MRVLVACEESQEVTKAFRARGHEAYSCDVLPCSGGHPEWHIQGDVLKHLNDEWDMMIAFPPCTFLTTTANRVFANNPERWFKRYEAAVFVKTLLDSGIEKISLENPGRSTLSTFIGKPSQYIQPYDFGHKDSKLTGLWLKNLPPLTATNTVEPIWITSPSGKRHSETHWKNPSTGNPDNAKLRSKTYPGIAQAMAEQWG